MQSLDDDERKQALGEVLADELKAIREFVQDVPDIKQKVHKINTKVDEISDRLTVIENVVRDQDTDLRILKKKSA